MMLMSGRFHPKTFVISRSRSAALLLCLLAAPLAAEARERGLAGGGCEGCHDNHDDSTVSASPASAALGETVTLTFTIADDDAEVAGIFIEAEDLPGVSVKGGSQLAVVSGGVTHTSPRAFSSGKAAFSIDYRVPSVAGSTRFSVWSVAGNGDGRNGGDEGNSEVFDLVFGCSPQTFYRDLDGDGHGRQGLPRTGCENLPPSGYAPVDDDCDDNSEERYPGATEFCNRKDDDCDGEIDENALPVALFPDADGDGYYSYEEGQSTDTLMGCLPYPGYGDQSGDCNPEEAAVNPGALEVCDMLLDEDCDGRIDERVRPICGEGWCRRESLTCSLEDCTPGDPTAEECNFLDDDCDGDVDEGELCPAGQACLAGECRDGAELDGSMTPTTGNAAKGSDSKSQSRMGCASGPGKSPPASILGLLLLVVIVSSQFARARLFGLRSTRAGSPRRGI